jgi:hypothetical protein
MADDIPVLTRAVPLEGQSAKLDVTLTQEQLDVPGHSQHFVDFYLKDKHFWLHKAAYGVLCAAWSFGISFIGIILKKHRGFTHSQIGILLALQPVRHIGHPNAHGAGRQHRQTQSDHGWHLHPRHCLP